MLYAPPVHPDIHRQLKARMLELSPRAFELFAGDLLVYIGLQDVVVTRFSGDGGIDACGDLIADSGLIRIRAGVQVKRHRRNVRRADIDQLIGAYGGTYDRGIFITTAGYATQARHKAMTSPLLRVDTIDGDQVASLMLQHNLGVEVLSHERVQLDKAYFLTYELATSAARRQAGVSREVEKTGSETTGAEVQPEEDLISLRALSYALRVDQTTLRSWIERGVLIPDQHLAAGFTEGFFFRRDRTETLRQQLVRRPIPSTLTEWRQVFLDYARTHTLTKSYKPVLLQVLLHLADRNGEVTLDAVAQAFHSFYLQRERDGLPVEFGGPMSRPTALSIQDVRRLIKKYPLDRFLIQNFVEYDPQTDIIRVASPIWQELRAYDLLDLQASTKDQLRYYYEREARGHPKNGILPPDEDEGGGDGPD